MRQDKQRSEWYKFYQDRQNIIYKKHIETRYEEFIHYLINALPDKGKKPVHIHEAGCGAANLSLALYKQLKDIEINFHISMSDKCKDMLELAHENVPEAYKALIDMTKDTLPKADIIFSHGVLEHFNDEQIARIVANQLDSTDKVVHYVPSAKYKKPSFGDERLLTPEEWQEICNPTSIIEFNGGYDLILVWDKTKFTYPSFLIQETDSGDKIVPRTSSREHHVSYEGMSFSRYSDFFISRGKFSYPDAKYSWAKNYRYPTANEELIYGVK